MYQRIILKLSGEALAGDRNDVRFDQDVVMDIASQIKEVVQAGTQVALVIGGGNFWRGRSANSQMDRSKADQIGMLATVMNAIYMADALRQQAVEAVVQTPFPVGAMTELFQKDQALRHLASGRVVIFAGGLGHPFFSTDTITALRGAELEADVLLFAKNVDGVYDDDPQTNPEAKKIDVLPISRIVREHLKVIDLTAAAFCMEQKMPVLIFGLKEKNSIHRPVQGEKIGTLVTVEP